MRVSIASPLMQPSPKPRRVGIRIVTFEACSGFTHVTARWIAQPPKATFVTRLQPCRLPSRAARQLPDQSTFIWVESSSTDDSRLRGARGIADMLRQAANDTIDPKRPIDARFRCNAAWASYCYPNARSVIRHLVGAQQERLWYRQPERLGGREIDDKIEFGRLLDRNIARLRPAQNLVDTVGCAPP